jgi:hypothetical protein
VDASGVGEMAVSDGGMDLSPARGHCKGCGTEIASATSELCLSCYRKGHRPCPECNPGGHLAWKFQSHLRPASGRCGRCEAPAHPHAYVQLRCGTCNNERYLAGET